jgi:hypothetical protein
VRGAASGNGLRLLDVVDDLASLVALVHAVIDVAVVVAEGALGRSKPMNMVLLVRGREWRNDVMASIEAT